MLSKGIGPQGSVLSHEENKPDLIMLYQHKQVLWMKDRGKIHVLGGWFVPGNWLGFLKSSRLWAQLSFNIVQHHVIPSDPSPPFSSSSSLIPLFLADMHVRPASLGAAGTFQPQGRDELILGLHNNGEKHFKED